MKTPTHSHFEEEEQEEVNEEQDVPLTEWMLEAYNKNHTPKEEIPPKRIGMEQPILEPTSKDIHIEDLDGDTWLKKMQSKITSNEEETKETMKKYEKMVQQRQYDTPNKIIETDEDPSEKKENDFVLHDMDE
jgi:hypothetical protein